MRQFTLKTDTAYTRPHVDVHGKLTALIDSGADIPMCSNAMLLMSEFNAFEIPIPSSATVSGISGDVSGRVFELEYFQFGDLIYPHIHMFVPDRPGFKAHFLISASMMTGLICETDYLNHKVTITIPDGQDVVRHAHFVSEGEHFVFVCEYFTEIEGKRLPERKM